MGVVVGGRMTAHLFLVTLLLGAAQSTGTMSPTSDVSGNRARTVSGVTKAMRDWTEMLVTTSQTASGAIQASALGAASVTPTGSLTPRTVADIAGDVSTLKAAPATAIPVDGVTAAKALGLRALLRSRGSFVGLGDPVPTSGAVYTQYLWVGEIEVHARSYPGFYTAAYLRPIFDAFIGTVGGDATYPDSPADLLRPDGTWRYTDGQTARPVLQTPASLALMAALLHDRGDSGAYTTHKALIDRAMESPLHGANGLPTTTGNTIGWGYEDVDRPVGTPAFIGALYAWAYSELARVATDTGDASAAATYTARFNAMVSGLRTLRRSDGIYNISSSESGRHLPATALIVAKGLCTRQEAVESAAALQAVYLGGRSLFRGGVRLLAYPDFYLSGTRGIYQNGGYWLGPWSGWYAQALRLIGDDASARALMQDAVDELEREHRATGLGPYEWVTRPEQGSAVYGVAVGAMDSLIDSNPWDYSAVLTGGAGTEAFVDCHRGNRGRVLTIDATTATTVTVEVYGQPYTNVLNHESDAAKFASYGTETLIGAISLAGTTTATVSSGLKPAATFGGRLRFKISSGTAAAPGVTVTLAASTSDPVVSNQTPNFADEYASALSTTDYTMDGTFAVSAGRLSYMDTPTAATVVLNGVLAQDQVIRASVSSALYASRMPGLMVRYNDAQNLILSYLQRLGGNFCAITGQLVDGVWTEIGRTAFASVSDGTAIALHLEAVGSTVLVKINGSLLGTYTTTKLSAGTVGVYAYSSPTGPEEITWDSLEYFERQPIPPGYVLEYGGVTGLVTGESYSGASGATLLRDSTGAVVSQATITGIATITY